MGYRERLALLALRVRQVRQALKACQDQLDLLDQEVRTLRQRAHRDEPLNGE